MRSEIEAAYETSVRFLLEALGPAGHWRGRLSSSALATATASFALYRAARTRGDGEYIGLVHKGLAWLCRHANPDGGWGDTVQSASNLSTTVLAWAALRSVAQDGHLGGAEREYAVTRAAAWIRRRTGALDPQVISKAIITNYGEDRTFSAPILSMAALAGALGFERTAWEAVPQLPFELAALPRTWFRRLGLQVVSYALPALISIGIVRHVHAPTKNPLRRSLRVLSRERVLRLLESIQPASGGYLEATPLTSFVLMSLCASGLERHPVVGRAVRFLTDGARPDGSWPIDSDLATWVTTLAVNALAERRRAAPIFDGDLRVRLREWLLAQQHTRIHPYTNAPPGGWAWTDRPGGVPDADDTAGALVALRHLDDGSPRVQRAVSAGLRWLATLQNPDGGIPTFCRGWGRLPFDQSSPDLTAHALRAFDSWAGVLPRALRRVRTRCVEYLSRSQQADGSWVPLWFGNEKASAMENRTYGTARVLTALRGVTQGEAGVLQRMKKRGISWLLEARGAEGGWGGGPGIPPTIEETGAAIAALADGPVLADPHARRSVEAGARWLAQTIEEGGLERPAPIGLYFAKLWYAERLYPAIFAAGGLGRLLEELSHRGRPGSRGTA